MKKFQFLFLIPVVFVLLMAYGLQGTAKGASLDSEALKIVTEAYKPYVAKCGDFYTMAQKQNAFSNTWIEFFQRKTYNLAVKEFTSEADRMNGITWKGQGILTLGGPSRTYYKQISQHNPPKDGNRWRPWTEENPSPYTLNLQKKNGQWTVEPVEFRMKLTCSDVPN